jgi:hypothetical protein
MNLQLQQDATHSHYDFLQAPILCSPLLSQKLTCEKSPIFPYEFPFSQESMTLTLPNVVCTSAPCPQ